jgi:cytochrome P450
MAVAHLECLVSALTDLACNLQARRFRPFGAGVRNCLGQQLAHVNIPTAVAMLVGNFKMQLSDEVGGGLATQCMLDWPYYAW